MYAKLLTAALVAATATTVSAESAPGYSGWNNVWTETFNGAAGSSVNSGNWNIITGLKVNNEVQTYTTSNQNLQLSGGATLQIVPRKDSSGAWTSARIESKYTFTPTAGARTLAEAKIRFGDNAIANKQGIWPAFWLLGNSVRNGVAWPACGEIDVMETVNGILTGHGTLHCDVYPNGACGEPNGIGGPVNLSDQGWHTWRAVWDRRASSWSGETITWYLDGNQFFQVSGARVGSQSVWNTLAGSPVYFILNVAVGGNWPGPPNSATLDGYGSMMEVAYVAQYVA
ncbi:glycoside hydrolase family 16 protein [Annulohypoxylon maeteangense]|uniref:glycoside hydrolase family 16 protein n=1 Tax=Annulohypoxylon maeteangense TaxID=1927788 RepID=UPI002007BC1D|nr:glycoside hydrolase family 16 protein [Annulohypoxylon maeteangense]KAI0888302.1 glycoside hydrolase family 16 protein [Annulohypoxylon maeteangense]